MCLKSVFCLECLCSRHIETEARTLKCPSCDRELVIEWGREEKTHSEAPESIEMLNVQFAA
jgi:competence CoiA-like predicted nuclease